MTAQSVNTSFLNGSRDIKSGRSFAAGSNRTNTGFSSVMDNNLKSKETVHKSQDSNNVSQDNLNKKQTVHDKTDSSVSDKSDKTAIRASDKNADKNISPDKNQKNIEQPSDKLIEDNQDNDMDDSILKSIAGLLAMLESAVQNNLGITKEQLDKAMENLGFTAADLLNPDNLKRLALQINGAEDITAMLTDEKLAKTINELIQSAEELKSGQAAALTPEKVKELLQNAAAANTENRDNENVNALTANVAQDQDVKEKNETFSAKQNDITIEVNKMQEHGIRDAGTEKELSGNEGRQDADVKAETPLDLLIQNLSMNGKDSSTDFNAQISNIRQMQNITNQIVEQIKIVIKPDQSSMELQLNPESLGKINLSVVAKDGVMTAHFTAQNEMVKEAIESQMQVLKDNLNNQGLKVESIEVTVSNFSFDQSGQMTGKDEKGQQSRSKNRELAGTEPDSFTGNKEELAQNIDLMEQNGNSIDYTA